MSEESLKKGIQNNSAIPLLNTAAKGSAIAFAGSIAGKILALLLQVLISRLFGPKYYGLFITAVITCQIFRIPASLGLQKGCMRFLAIAIEGHDYRALPGIYATAVIFPVIFGILVSAGLYLLSPYMAITLFHDADMVTVLRKFSLAVPFFALLNVGSELSRGFRTTKYSVFIENLVFPSSQIAFFLILCYVGFGFSSVIYSFILASVLSSILILLIVQYQIKKTMGPAWSPLLILNNLIFPRRWREILAYSIPFMPIAAILISYNYVDIIMLNIFVDSQRVGEYAAAARLGLLFATLLHSTNLIFAPLIAGLYGTNNMANIKILYKTVTRWMFYVSFPMVIFVLIANKQIMMIFGEEFMQYGPMVLVILSIGHVFASITGGVGMVLTMTGHQYKELMNVAGSIVLNIILNLLLIPSYGLIGAAIATTLSRFVIQSVRVLIVFHLFKMQPLTKKFITPVVTGLVIYILYLFIPGKFMVSNLAELFFGMAGVCITLVSILKIGFEKDDYHILSGFWQKISNSLGPTREMRK